MDDVVTQNVRNEEALPAVVKIHATVVSKLNLADFQNAVPVIRELRISNDTSARYRELVLSLSASPEVFKPKRWNIDALVPGAYQSIPGLDLILDGAFLGKLTEAEGASLTFILTAIDVDSESGRSEIAQVEVALELLPRNQWGGLNHIPDMTAAFVQPNDLAVERLLKKTADVLRKSGKNSALDGYAGGAKRAWELASAVWAAVARMKLDYALPPASFEQYGQKVRSPSHITDSGLATCFDLTLFFCAALEQAGLNPVVVFTEGHAFAGVWLKAEEFSSTVIDDITALRKRLKLRELILFETTLATQQSVPSFSYATERGAAQVAEGTDQDFHMLLDVRRARLQRIKPLASGDTQIARSAAELEDSASVELLVEEAPALPDETASIEIEDLSKLDPKDRLGRWQRKLLDLSLRNNLLNFKSGKKALKLEAPDPGALEDILASGQTLKLMTRPDLMDGADPRERALYEEREREDVRRLHALDALKRREVFVALSSREMEARLTELFRGARTALQEGGSNTLFLAIGFLSWTRDDRAGQKYRAPLILVPVTLERKSARSGFSVLLHDDEPRFNPTLIEMLRQDFELGLGKLESELPRDDAGLDIAAIWKTVGQAVKDIPGWEVSEEVVLSMFSFAKYLMWKDLAESAEHLRESPVVKHLLDSPRDSFASDVMFPDAQRLDVDYGPQEVFCPLPADSSQLSAVMAASKGKDFVLIGPPGTGKSQTIANLIAQSIAQGKRVLFVSEKIAALDVVYRRLREVGLGEFCLEVHSSKSRKADVLAQLQSAWEAKGEVDTAAWSIEAERLRVLRDGLNLYVSRLHQRHTNGFTIFDAIGVVTGGGDVPAIDLKWAAFDTHDREALFALRELSDRLEVNAQAVGYTNLKGHAFVPVGQSDWSPSWQQQFVQAARELLPAIADVERGIGQFVSATSLPSVALTPRVIKGLVVLSEALPMAAGHDWRFVLLPNGRAIAQSIKDGIGLVAQHRDLNARLSPIWPTSVISSVEDGIEIVEKRISLLTQLQEPWPTRTTAALGIAVEVLGRISELMKQLSVGYTDAIESLDIAQLLDDWNKAEESIWPRSWFGCRVVRKTLTNAAEPGTEPDVAKDLGLWSEIRTLRRTIDDLVPGEQVGEVWKGSRSNAGYLQAVIALQAAISAQKINQAWSDTGFEVVDQGRLGTGLKSSLSEMRLITKADTDLTTLGETLSSTTHGLWKGLGSNLEALRAAMRFQKVRRTLNEQGGLDDEHELVASGHCGNLMKSDHALLVERRAVERALAELSHLRDAVPGLWSGLSTKVDVGRQALEFYIKVTQGLAQIATTPEQASAVKAPLQLLLGEGNTLLEPQGPAAQIGAVFCQQVVTLSEKTSALATAGSFTARGLETLGEQPLSDLQAQCEQIVRSEAQFKAWCAWRKVRDESLAVGLAPLIAHLEEGHLAVGSIRKSFEVNYARWWLNAIVDVEPVIRSFVSVEHEQRIRDFRALDERFTTLTRDWLRARLCKDLPSQEGVSRSSEWGLLRHEMNKKTRHIPLRELMSQAPEALAKLTPCLLMSPLSIAQYLSPGATPFDVVIFDEASQIPIWDAVGAMARGRQVVMVGDPKQLPPTSFFDRAESTADDEDVEADLESILDECISANLPIRNLNWHYRSRHESLIAFSNQRYYESKLVTFPSPVTADRAVRFAHAPGVYEKGGSRTNPIEARALVADVVARLRSPGFRESGHTIGVVTFNGEQQRLIEDLLDAARRSDPFLEPYFSESELEPVFVKNLESVQGDERDIIYFSITYAKDAAGVMSMNFGPLNRPGGERRLNVAITRARQELVVFSSLKPEFIDLARTQAAGVRDLKHFLEFAERGPRALAEATAGSVGGFDSPFEESVATALSKRGWQVQTQVGVSGFRIDLGVIDPEAPGRYLAGVECDGATYHRTATARDRDKLREQVLRGLGWEILRIWSTDWWVDATGTAERIHQRLNGLLETSRAKRKEQEARDEAARQLEDSAAAEVLNIPEAVGTLTHEQSEAKSANDEGSAASQRLYANAQPPATNTSPELTTGGLVEALVYRESDPTITVAGINPDEFFSDSYTDVLCKMIAHVVEAEGPVLDVILARRIARAHGWVRTGSRIRDRVTKVAFQGHRSHEEEVGHFYWPERIAENSSVVFRRPANDDSIRSTDEVSTPELLSLARVLSEKGRAGDALLQAMAKELGLQKLSAASRLRLEKVAALLA